MHRFQNFSTFLMGDRRSLGTNLILAFANAVLPTGGFLLVSVDYNYFYALLTR